MFVDHTFKGGEALGRGKDPLQCSVNSKAKTTTSKASKFSEKRQAAEVLR